MNRPFRTDARQLVSERLPRAPNLNDTAVTGAPMSAMCSGVTGHCDSTGHIQPLDSSVVSWAFSAAAASRDDANSRMNSSPNGALRLIPAEALANRHALTKNDCRHGA